MIRQWLKQLTVLQAALWTLLVAATAVRADIFKWEYINPADPSQGKRQSTMLAPDGAGVDAVARADFGGRDLTMVYLIGADLTNAYGYKTNLTKADLSTANLTNADFLGAILADANFTGAELRDARFAKVAQPGAAASEPELTCRRFAARREALR